MARRALDPGVSIGGYVVERQLGAGGSGEVYLVRDGAGNPAALKRVDAQHDEVAAERLRREVRALMAIRHPAVPRVRDAELEEDETFVVFEFIEGESLAAEVAERGPLVGEDLAFCAERIAGALEAAHAAGLVHRDVTPSNVMMSPAGAVLIDFGLSHREDDDRLTREGLVSGTSGYVAPEVIDGVEPGIVADRWSWAATVAYAMTGEAPFGTGNSAIRRTLQGKWKVPEIQGAHALAAALDRDLDARPGMRDVIAALRGATTVLPREAVPATTVMHSADDAPGGTAVLPVDVGWQGDDADGGADGDGSWDDTQTLEDGSGEDFDQFLLSPSDEVVEDVELSPRRPVLVVAWAVAASAGAMLAPIVTAAIITLAALIARTVFQRSEAIRQARARRGERRMDALLHTVGVPWHVLRAFVEMLPSLIAALVIGVGIGALGWWLVSSGAAAPEGADAQAWGHAIALAIGALAFVGALWWGLWSWRTREGAYRVAEALAPTTGVSAAWIVVALIVTGSFVVAVYVGADPWWWPFPQIPQVMG
ncbi:serine/threonine protein kinase [Demequina sp. TTPB684]|uniref:serine/threonine-protein kinase n=1 Tax=unclassified Demequina TaxID=2620311 RepID=UPI001CF32274|nr:MULTISPECIES: serine/threonine-protein kinase [unclassified Demequina]MCB2412818.1 serine/threonine protein kinase [Demequina sp. TTPB684]UPU87454.1 serine/threonine protein kinase [Demequina sp. TMPB413]